MEGSEKMRLRWVRISPTLSDETVSFRVEGCAGMRLREFIKTVLREGPRPCGNFRVYANYYTSAALAMDALVSSARCNGGWGQMNYEVVIAWKGGEHAEA